MGTKQHIYVGTYTLPITFGTGQVLNGKGKGIYVFEFDPDVPDLKPVSVAGDIDNPSYLAVNEKAGALYAVSELKDYNGKPSGAVGSFRIRDDGGLELTGKLPTDGADPCHVVLGPDMKHLIVSNYSGGSVSVFPVLPDGGLGEIEQFVQYEGGSVNPARQEGPHAHSAVFSRDSKYVFVCDLGTDRVNVYRYAASGPPLSDKCRLVFKTTPGSGPRCMEFGPDGRYGYLIREMESSISVLWLDKEGGMLTEIQKASTLPEGADNRDNLGADLHLTPDGRFLYASNRGYDNIAIFQVEPSTGLLTLVGFEPAGGQIPRSFCIDATGGFLLCANQDSDNVVVFSIDRQTGGLQKKCVASVPTPVCVRAY